MPNDDRCWCPLGGGGVAAGVDTTDCEASKEACTPFMEDVVLLREKDGGCNGGPGCSVEAMQPVEFRYDWEGMVNGQSCQEPLEM